MIAANSMHKVAEDVAAAISIPILHIVDETGEKMKADGVKSAAVIGTRNVMTEPWFRQRRVRHGLTLAPFDASRADEVDRPISDELMLGQANARARRPMKPLDRQRAASGKSGEE